MAEYIEKNFTKDHLQLESDCGYIKTLEDVFKVIDAIPSVNAVVLPCKVGDTVYEVHNNTNACGDCDFYCCGFGDVWCEKIEDVDLREYPDIAEKPLCEKQFMEVREYTPDLNWIFHHREDFGKTVFLTREEAEEALEGREDKEVERQST